MNFDKLIPQHSKNADKFTQKAQELLDLTPNLYDVEVINIHDEAMEFYGFYITNLEKNGTTEEDEEKKRGLTRASDGMDTESSELTYVKTRFATAEIEYLRTIVKRLDILAAECGSPDEHTNDEYKDEDSDIRPGNENQFGLPVWVFRGAYSFEDNQ
jgi:hypothetical protein